MLASRAKRTSDAPRGTFHRSMGPPIRIQLGDESTEACVRTATDPPMKGPALSSRGTRSGVEGRALVGGASGFIAKRYRACLRVGCNAWHHGCPRFPP